MAASEPRPRPRFPWGLTLVCGVALAILLALGTWQIQRLQWKTALISEAQRASALLPEAPSYVLDARNPEFMKVALICPGLATAPYVELRSIRNGQPGVRLISACRHPGYGPVLLIDRGFVADTISTRPAEAASGTVHLIAEVRRTPSPGPMALAGEGRQFYARDNTAMARALGVDEPVSAWTLFALTSSNPDWAALQPSAPPAAYSNNHLGYALTWYGLALALIGFYIALLRRRNRSAT